MTTIDLANVINITIQGTPTILEEVNINTVALISQEVPTGWGSETYRIYKNAAGIGTDFGTSSDAYNIALSFFAQQPNPLSTQGYLAVIPRLQTPSLEDIEDTIVRTLNDVFYVGILIDEELSGVPATFASLSTYVNTLDKMLFYASSVSTEYDPDGMLDLVRQANEKKTRTLFYDGAAAIDTQKFAAAYAARAMSTNFNGSNTATTMHLKGLTGFVADSTINQTELDQAKTAGVDTYPNFGGLAKLFTSGGNVFYDQVYGELWLKLALQTAGFNYLAATNTKIPQTEPGIEGLKNQYRAVCDLSVTNGFAAPGSWTSPDVFGDTEALIRSVSDIGYYVYSQPITQQSQSERDLRIAPLVQIALKLAGAIHESNVIVNINP